MKGYRRRAFVAAALATSAAFTAPASAQGVVTGAGVVSGTVTLSPGLSAGCGAICDQIFGFSGVTLVGAFVGLGNPTGVNLATINATASGGSSPSVCATGVENAAGGIGCVNNVSGTGTDSCTGVCVFLTPPAVCIVACTTSDTVNESGMYVRVGAIVITELTGSLTVTCTSAPCTGQSTTYSPFATLVEALFIPNQTPPATTVSATFIGPFEVVGAAA